MTVRTTFDFGKLTHRANAILADGLNDIATHIVDGIQAGIAAEKDIDNASFHPLKPATIRRKKGPGILWETGRMVKGTFVSKRASAANLKAIVRPPLYRQAIGGYHNEGAGNLPQREWFGVPKRSDLTIDRLIKHTAKKIVAAVHK